MDFRFFDNYPSKRMRFLRSHDTLSLVLYDIMTCMHMSITLISGAQWIDTVNAGSIASMSKENVVLS